MTAAFGTMAIVPSFWAGLAAASLAQYLGLGLFERYIRQRAQQARTTADHDAA